MEFALAVLLVSSLTCVGLLALWAATSGEHWFVRTAVFAGVLSLLLLVPAFEPFAIFMCQGLVIAIGIQSNRFWQNRSSPTNWSWRFSLTDILLFTTLVAFVVPTAIALLADEWLDWHNVWQLGIASGVVVLLAWWCLACMSYSRKKKAGAVLGCLLVLSATLSWIEPSLLSSILYVDEWFNFGLGPWQVHLWFTAFGLIFLAVLLLGTLAAGGKRLLLVGLSLIVGMPSVYCYYRLMTPLPIPQIELPSPNGYDDLVAAGKLADSRLINFWGETPIEQLVAGLPKFANVYERAELGFSRTVRVPVKFESYDVDVDSCGALRSLARAFGARGDVHLASGDIEKTMDDYLTISMLGSQSRNGGVLIHWMVATAIDGVGEHALYQIHKQMNASQCLRAIETYAEIESSTDSLEKILYRERVWCERAYGFYGRLSVILDDLVEEGHWSNLQIENVIAPRYRAKHQLLLTTLAIRAYDDVHGTLPTNLAQLVPEFLEQLPLDPFDVAGGALRYQANGEEYRLYSIGQNQVDDGGLKPEQDADGLNDHETGDLLLDVVFAPWEAEEAIEEESKPSDEAFGFGE